MLDTFHIQDNSLANQAFYYKGNSWQTWQKPQNCNFINFFLLGGGAGGTGGGTGGAGSTRNGGSGGGSSSVTYVTFPSYVIPDIVYILVGSGGTGSISSSVQGGVGGLSYVSVLPDFTFASSNIIMASGSAPAGLSVSSTAGAAITTNNILLAEMAFISSYAGQTGGAGGSSSGTAPDITPTGIPITAGSGGGGCNSVSIVGTSGNIAPFLFSPKISGGTASTTATATTGNNGFSTRNNFVGPNFEYPLFFTGGAGGGASDSGQGGNGGNGAFGCGGGGGGTGGNGLIGLGGNGGNGLVIITTL